ncbi:hypothetical protein GCM10028778_16070 [Barrientosiimonas marina]|uniref:Transposase n=2 Tax=Lentibacillus kimchii TaxID=1542911 RepID=A0ABW2UQ45_9BACI
MPKRRFSAEEKAQIVIRGLGNEISVKELCQEVGIQPKSYYEWKQIFMKHGMEGFNSKRNQKDTEKEEMKKEVDRLKELVADLSLENHVIMFKKKTTFKALS